MTRKALAFHVVFKCVCTVFPVSLLLPMILCSNGFWAMSQWTGSVECVRPRAVLQKCWGVRSRRWAMGTPFSTHSSYTAVHKKTSRCGFPVTTSLPVVKNMSFSMHSSAMTGRQRCAVL